MVTRGERAMSFGSVAADYDRLRPGPPDVAVDWLLPAACTVAVDVGAGTGLLTRALARRVPRVVAVEPDERMRAVLQARSPGIEALDGRGEAIPLPDASADGVFISSAWHWMDPDLAAAEVTRVLRDGGRFGLIWTSRDRTGWLREITDRARPGADGGGPGGAGGRGPGQRVAPMPASAPLENMTRESFSFTRTMSVDDLIEQLGTYSMMITAGPGERAGLLAGARAALSERFPGATEVDVPMRSQCWRANRVSRG
jgi:SAM-dependent methyltransferase